MSKLLRFQLAILLFANLCFLGVIAQAAAQDNKVMGEVQFDGMTKVEKDSGVWVDGGYVGYLKELKGNKKVLLLPGEHEISVRQSGYDNFEQKIVVEPGGSGTKSRGHGEVESYGATGTCGGVSGRQIRWTRERVGWRDALDADQSGETRD